MTMWMWMLGPGEVEPDLDETPDEDDLDDAGTFEDLEFESRREERAWPTEAVA